MDVLWPLLFVLALALTAALVARSFDTALRQRRRGAAGTGIGRHAATAERVRREVAEIRRTLRDDADEFDARGREGR